MLVSEQFIIAPALTFSMLYLKATPIYQLLALELNIDLIVSNPSAAEVFSDCSQNICIVWSSFNLGFMIKKSFPNLLQHQNHF